MPGDIFFVDFLDCYNARIIKTCFCQHRTITIAQRLFIIQTSKTKSINFTGSPRGLTYASSEQGSFVLKHHHIFLSFFLSLNKNRPPIFVRQRSRESF